MIVNSFGLLDFLCSRCRQSLPLLSSSAVTCPHTTKSSLSLLPLQCLQTGFKLHFRGGLINQLGKVCLGAAFEVVN